MNSMTMVTITNIIVKPQQSGWLGIDPITNTMTSMTIAPRHDNLNSFIGAAVEPHSITVVTDYGSRGSLRFVYADGNFKEGATIIYNIWSHTYMYDMQKNLTP